jgi:hypothetical protein
MATSLEMHVTCQVQAAVAELLISAAKTVLVTIFKAAVCTDVGETVTVVGAEHTITKDAAKKCSGELVWLQTVMVIAITQTSIKVRHR